MLLMRLYNRSPRWLQSAMLSARGFQYQRQRRGGAYRRALDLLLRNQWMQPGDLLAWQVRRFRDVFTEACLHVPHYRQLFSDLDFNPKGISDLDFVRQLPFLTKDDLRSHGQTFVNHNRKIVYVSRTGGTTGAPLISPYDAESLQWAFAILDRFYQSAGVDVRSRSLHLTGQQVVPTHERKIFGRRNYAANSLFLSIHHLSPQNLPQYWREIMAFRPLWIEGYASFIYEIAEWVNQNGRAGELPLVAVFPTSELLTDGMRASIEKAFATRVFDHYSATEGIPIITQCPAGRYHVVPESGIVEFLRPDGSPAAAGEPAEMVMTSFRNLSRPLLRYRIGDTGAWSDQSCPCGRHWMVVERLSGRLAEWVVNREGKRISQFSHQIFKLSHNVLASQIVQHDPEYFELLIVRATNYGPDDERFLRDRLIEVLGHGARVEFRYVAEIPRTPGGKRPSVISKPAQQFTNRAIGNPVGAA